MKIDMKEVYEQKTALSNSKTSIDAQLKTAKTSFVNLVHSESLKGDVKGAINAKITNHQVPLLTNFSNALAVLLAQYEKTIKQFQSTVSENAVDAIIDTEYLQGLLDGFSDLETNISTVDKATATIYSSISDILSLTNPDASTITTPLSEGKKILTDTKTNMASFNGWERGDEYSKVLQSQTQTLESLSTMAGLSFTDAEAKAFYSSQDFLKAVKEISTKANGSTPVELLGLISKTINKDLGKWKRWNAYDHFVAFMGRDEVKRIAQILGLTPSKLTKAFLKSDGIWEILDALEKKGPKAYKFVSKILDGMAKYESLGKFGGKLGKALGKGFDWLQKAASPLKSFAKWGLQKVSGFKSLEEAIKTGKNLVGDAKFLGKGIKFLGKLGTVATFAELGITGISSGINEYSKSGDWGKAAGRGALDAVASVGPLEGATIGGAIGSAVPIFGTTAGAVIGGVVGAAIQGIKWLEPKFFDDPVKGTKNIVNKVGNGIKGVADAVSNGIGGIGKALGFG